MKQYVFDIEADGLLGSVTTIHSLVLCNPDNEAELFSFADQPGYKSIREGLQELSTADVIIGHNILCYDIPAILKIYPEWKHAAKIRDTLNMSRLMYADENIHSLGHWGKKLNCYKGDFNEFEKWTKRMQQYCEQDVKVNVRLYNHLMSQEPSERALQLEMDLQEIIHQQELNGVCFDKEKAMEYYHQLNNEAVEIKKELLNIYPGWTDRQNFIPKRNNRAKGYIAGVPIWKEKFVEFNPNSRQQCLKLFKEKYNWTPSDKTEKGNPKLDSAVLANLSFPEAKMLSKLFDIKKVTGRLFDGNKSWVKLVRPDGKVSAKVITNGAVSGRCTHQGVANIPRMGTFFGAECRSLFHAGDDLMVGADASGLELRIFAHYLAKYDGGRYVKIVTEGDVHTANQEAAGLETRDQSKTFIYATLYGAGQVKVGSIAKPEASESLQQRIGKKLREQFERNTPGYKDLVRDVQRATRRGYLLGIDGRKLTVRSEHSALNLLLQSTGAIIMKEADVVFWQMLREKGLDKYTKQLIFYHDEINCSVNKEHTADEVGQTLVKAIITAGKNFNLRCPLDAEYKTGKTWLQIH